MLLLAMLIWGSTFVVTKEVIGGLPPFALAFVRVALAAVVLLPLAQMRRRHQETEAVVHVSQPSRLPWGAIFAMGFIGVAAYYALFNLSLAYTSASQGALVQSCLPAMTALVAVVWLRERASLVRWIGIALSIAGVAIVFSGAPASGAKSAVLGGLLMFATTILWGVYTALAKRTTQFDSISITTAMLAVGAVMLLPIAAVEIAGHGMPRLSLAGWLGVLYLGVVASGVAFILYNAALKHMDASLAGAYTNLIPIIGVIAGVIVLGEPLSARAILGGGIVFLGVWITSLQRTPRKDASEVLAQ